MEVAGGVLVVGESDYEDRGEGCQLKGSIGKKKHNLDNNSEYVDQNGESVACSFCGADILQEVGIDLF